MIAVTIRHWCASQKYENLLDLIQFPTDMIKCADKITPVSKYSLNKITLIRNIRGSNINTMHEDDNILAGFLAHMPPDLATSGERIIHFTRTEK